MQANSDNVRLWYETACRYAPSASRSARDLCSFLIAFRKHSKTFWFTVVLLSVSRKPIVLSLGRYLRGSLLLVLDHKAWSKRDRRQLHGTVLFTNKH